MVRTLRHSLRRASFTRHLGQASAQRDEAARSKGKLQLARNEFYAFAKQASLIHRDLPANFPREIEPGEHVVVLLHGLFASAGVLRPLRRNIETAVGAQTATFSYAPGPGVEHIAGRLAKLVDQLPAHAQVHLVGHSMGGVVARWYVQELGGRQRVASTISMGSPFRGTRHARLMPAKAGRDIHPASELLSRLRSQAPSCPVSHLSLSAERDQVVTECTHLPGKPSVVIRDCGHNGLLYHPRAQSVIVDRLQQATEAPASSLVRPASSW